SAYRKATSYHPRGRPMDAPKTLLALAGAGYGWSLRQKPALFEGDPASFPGRPFLPLRGPQILAPHIHCAGQRISVVDHANGDGAMRPPFYGPGAFAPDDAADLMELVPGVHQRIPA